MGEQWGLISNFVVALAAIVNPIEKIPLWVKASKGMPRRHQWLLAGLITMSSAVVLLVFLWFGRQLLARLQIDLASFKIGGGLILLRFGFNMLNGTAIEIEEDAPGADRASAIGAALHRYQQVFIPLGVPVIAGPGAITTVIIYGYQSGSPLDDLMLSIAIIAILAILFLTLLTGPAIQGVTGELPLNLISRIFGMVLIAIAVQFMVEGLTTVFPGLVPADR